ncbi:Alpha-soluble NSF attachment protein, partial [Araneus ventricosus]
TSEFGIDFPELWLL